MPDTQNPGLTVRALRVEGFRSLGLRGLGSTGFKVSGLAVKPLTWNYLRMGGAEPPGLAVCVC